MVENIRNKEDAVLYAVFRSGIRVSDSTYTDKKDNYAIQEKKYWERILSQFPDGTKIDILPVRYRDRV